MNAEFIIVGNYFVFKDSKSGSIGYFRFFKDDGTMIDTEEQKLRQTQLFQLKIGKLLEQTDP